MNISPTSLLKDTELETVVGRLMPLKVYTPDLTTTVGKLKHLRHVVDGVALQHFDMGRTATKTECGTVGCIAGHAALDPFFNEIGLHAEVDESHCRMSFNQSGTIRWYEALGSALAISGPDARWLTTDAKHPGETYPVSKTDALARIDHMISKYSAGES